MAYLLGWIVPRITSLDLRLAASALSQAVDKNSIDIADTDLI
jgi:hypothetical protein